MTTVIVRNGDINQALKVLKRKFDLTVKEALNARNSYRSRGERQRRKRMRGRARWRARERVLRERGQID